MSRERKATHVIKGPWQFGTIWATNFWSRGLSAFRRITPLGLQVCGRAHFLCFSHIPIDHRAPNDTMYFHSPAVIPSWIWELFPQMVDSLKKIFKNSNLPLWHLLCETRFCKVFTAAVSGSQSNPQKYLGVKKRSHGHFISLLLQQWLCMQVCLYPDINLLCH